MSAHDAATVIVVQGGGLGAHAEDALLAASLRDHLDHHTGGIVVDFPVFPDEGSPDPSGWAPVIERVVARASGPLVLVGHSVGGFVLVEYLAARRPLGDLRAICLLATPFPGGDADWTFDGFAMPDGLDDAIPAGVPVFLYASEDDDTVPFAHRDLWAARLPGARARTTTGGHQFGNDLEIVADDIRVTLRG
ncbi:alpha/beta fold hydrolase [Herbiconiux sp. L3-i23]|uniref:alpha/beta fold hydrolase n=1 Tax=Herbiconiux sp. L3-i23 TaxID=2905871 RepID=UPI0020471DCC|nr:alpha/beta fold hydrolase [Herbiconiux sp. L3-i23]BDI22085.1 hypothetical protein L3i23_08610 [Herbiconiux sp. L3-i23]